MSLIEVKKVLEEAHKNKKFRDLLMSDPETALKGFSLTNEEKEKFKGVSEKKLASYKNNIENRYSKDSSAAAGEWWVSSVID